MNHENSTNKKTGRYILYALFGLLLALSAAMFSLCVWYKKTFDIEFKTLLYVLASPLQGTGSETVKEVIRATVPAALTAIAVYVACVLLIERILAPKKPRLRTVIKRIGALLCAVSLVLSCIYGVFVLRIPRYIELKNGETSFYEEYYIKPDSALITSSGKTKNLIYIYLESMETTYTSTEDGGKQAENYMPRLTSLALDNVSFSDKADGNIGGFLTPQGTGWTIAALLATSSGIPFSFPLGDNGNNAMSKEEYFASGLVTLGDILHEKGYNQYFLCGSEIEFGGRDKYYIQHGSYDIYDLNTARAEGVVPEDYHNGFWGFEDCILFDIAKEELTDIASSGEPFNFTMLTVDAHHNGGYKCELCGSDYTDLSEKYAHTANVITCIDKQTAEFVEWCQTQDWYEDTVIVISGDHPRMDSRLVSKVPATERPVYNCIINAEVTPEGSTSSRVWTSFDMFPTTLAAMGFEIIGDRLGLGTNMFSDTPTLAEELGYDVLETEIQKYSQYYIDEFCPELKDRVVLVEETGEGEEE